MTIINYLWDEDSYLEEYDEVGTTTAAYTNEPTAFGSVISQRRNTDTNFYHYDVQGSTHQLTDQNENVTDAFLYDAWGNEITRTGTTNVVFTYIGELGYYSDGESESFYVRARNYVPSIARWVSQDPDRFSDGMNLYLYVKSNPINRSDPSGLQSLPNPFDKPGKPDLPNPFDKPGKPDLPNPFDKPSGPNTSDSLNPFGDNVPEFSRSGAGCGVKIKGGHYVGLNVLQVPDSNDGTCSDATITYTGIKFVSWLAPRGFPPLIDCSKARPLYTIDKLFKPGNILSCSITVDCPPGKKCCLSGVTRNFIEEKESTLPVFSTIPLCNWSLTIKSSIRTLIKSGSCIDSNCPCDADCPIEAKKPMVGCPIEAKKPVLK